jgi:hypothetical protein
MVYSSAVLDQSIVYIEYGSSRIAEYGIYLLLKQAFH